MLKANGAPAPETAYAQEGGNAKGSHHGDAYLSAP